MSLIKNEAILSAVQEQLQKNNITEADILSITELNLSRKNLTDVSDLERFTNLVNLDIVENCLTDLSPLAGLKNLRRLAAGNDPFLSEEDRSKRKGINHFADYSFLKHLTGLIDIDFTATGDDNIEYVKYLPNVEEFRAYSNPITDISPLLACKKLHQSYFYDCPITDISVYRRLPDTFGLAVNCTGVSDLTPLAGKTKFSYLDAHDAEIEDISTLADFASMRYVTLARNKIRDFSPLRGKTVGWLTLSGNPAEEAHLLDVLGSVRVTQALEIVGYHFTEAEKHFLEEKQPFCQITF